MNVTPTPETGKKYDTCWPDLFAFHRTVVARGDEIVQGVLRPGLGADHPAVASALRDWSGTHFVFPGSDGVEVTLVRRIAATRRERWWLHLLLGILTLLTTTIAGANFFGLEPLTLRFLPAGPFAIPFPVALDLATLRNGLAFSVPLLIALFGHEMAHFALARRHGVDCSPPYFIPSPHWINLIGTFGAFIRIRSVVVNRIVLLDVGMAGPLVSFLLSIPLIAAGLALSTPMPGADTAARYLVFFGGQPIQIGGSLVFQLLAGLIHPEGSLLLLHPLAFAGWLGLFVTTLNLLPLAQLDGGHILYALIGDRQRYLGAALLVALFALGFSWWGWWLWVGIILVIGRGSIRHPPVYDTVMPVTGLRRALGWSCVLIFVLTFVPVPIRI